MEKERDEKKMYKRRSFIDNVFDKWKSHFSIVDFFFALSFVNSCQEHHYFFLLLILSLESIKRD